jgi:hypothetical protein
VPDIHPVAEHEFGFVDGYRKIVSQ